MIAIYIIYTYIIYIYTYKICFHYSFMDKIETNFLTQEFKLLVCFRYIDDVFLIWTHGKEKLEEFLTTTPTLNLPMSSIKKAFPFWTLFYNKIDFERHLYNIKSWFQARSYPKHLAQNEMSKVRFNKENSNTKQTK